MADRQQELEYLRCKARQLRELASEHSDYLSAKMLELAKGLEARAADLEKSESLEVFKLPYRVYFREMDRIVGRDDFEAEHDYAAITIAETLCDACSDVCDQFELWQGVRRVGARSEFPKLNARQLNTRTQVAVIEREERLLDSKWAVAKSRRLLERLRLQVDP